MSIDVAPGLLSGCTVHCAHCTVMSSVCIKASSLWSLCTEARHSRTSDGSTGTKQWLKWERKILTKFDVFSDHSSTRINNQSLLLMSPLTCVASTAKQMLYLPSLSIKQNLRNHELHEETSLKLTISEVGTYLLLLSMTLWPWPITCRTGSCTYSPWHFSQFD